MHGDVKQAFSKAFHSISPANTMGNGPILHGCVTSDPVGYSVPWWVFSNCLYSGQGDLVEITDYLHPLVENRDIRSLGLVLGLHHDRLKAVEQTSDSFLDDVIAAWLRKEGDAEKKGGPHWSTLVKALQHQRLKQFGIARTIAEDKGLQSLMQQ